MIATVADLDGDELPDLFLGSTGGGLRYLKNMSQKIIATSPPEPWVYPNPTERYVAVLPPADGTLDVLSLTGQLVLGSHEVQVSTKLTLDLKDVATGMYIVRLITTNRSVLTQKIVIHK